MFRLFFAVLALTVSMQAYAGGIAVVDFNKAAELTIEGKRATARLEAFVSSSQKELEQAQSGFEQEVMEFQKGALVMSDAARTAREQELGQKQAALEQQYMATQQQLSQMQLELTTELGEKMRAVSQSIAKEKGYDLVLDKAVAAYVGPSIVDITGLLVERYDAANP